MPGNSTYFLAKNIEGQMKNLINASKACNNKNVAALQLLHGLTGTLFYLVVLLSVLLFTGCKKQAINETKSQAELQSSKEMQPSVTDNSGMNSDAEFLNMYDGLSRQTSWELQQARAATAKYRNFNNAIADGYADINVVVPNMGYHYMKSTLVDGTFDIRKPEILVYNKNVDGSFRLLAVEYAIPISLSPNAAPEGFTGDSDVWEFNTGFGLWLCHAWVWQFNPDGVFNPTNPLVQVH
jgi:hypothetical protein